MRLSVVYGGAPLPRPAWGNQEVVLTRRVRMSFAMKINGRSEAVKLHAKAAWIALLLVLLAVPAAAQPARPAPKEATEPVMKQLEAFRRGDFDTAYTFASADIRQQFDRPAFEQMVRGGLS